MEVNLISFTWVLLLIGFTSFQSVTALTCSYCTSQISMDDCETNSLNSDQCGKNSVCFTATYQMYGALMMHRKGCVNKNSCDKLTLCGASENDRRCRYKCCNTDYCNASSYIHNRHNIHTAIILSTIATLVLLWNL